ncbi:hypothetical protein [Bacteroides ihuae]|uniref:hypothetical protein n=1 Tax=Bacteroides ihuae TaxID=1852362 RepID=UPI0008DA273E|nr:hypothetical protein [Bacteroides ihuae]MBP1615968.1 hypothetical protein [Bacteroidota bacterium]
MKYLEILLEEKNISSETNLLENEGNFGLTIQMLIDFIYSMPANIRKQVENTFRKIDFMNGDVMNYINFLAKGMLKSSGY